MVDSRRLLRKGMRLRRTVGGRSWARAMGRKAARKEGVGAAMTMLMEEELVVVSAMQWQKW